MPFTGEVRKWLHFTYDKCCERCVVSHLCWLFLKMQLSPFCVLWRTG